MVFIKKYKKSLLSLLIFIIIICYYFLFKNWGIEADDCGNILNSAANSFKEFLNLFKGQHFAYLSFPDNFIHPTHNFLNVFYRPLFRVFLALELSIFGFKPFYFFIVTIFFHALNAILLFNIYLKIIKNYIWAFLLSLFFAFHCSIPVWMGWISAQNYAISMFFAILTVIFFLKFLKNNKYLYLIFSLLFYIFSIFLLEQTIFLPVFLLGLVYFKKNNNKLYFKNILSTLIYFFIIFLYFLLRIYLFGFGSSINNNFINFIKTTYYSNFATYIFELFNLSFIPAGNFIFKLFLLLIVIILFSYLFIKNKNKRENIFYLFLCFISIWTMFIKTYMSRNLYFVLPFFIYFVIILFVKKYQDNIYLKAFFIVLIIFNIRNNYVYLKAREYYSFGAYKSLKKIAKTIKTESNPVCFVGLPCSYINRVIHPARIYNYKKKLLAFADNNTFLENYDENTGFELNKINNIFNFKILNNKNNLTKFSGSPEFAMGEFKDLGIKNQEREYILNNKYKSLNIIFITWDYSNSKFKLL